MATDWGAVVGGVLEAAGKIYVAREQAKTERYAAKQASRGQVFYPQVGGYGYPGTIPGGGYPPQFPVAAQQQPLLGLPFPTGGGATVPMYSAPPYVAQPAGLTSEMGDLLQLYQRFTGGGAVSVPGGGNGGAIIDAPGVFYTGPGGTRARRFFATVNPATGSLAWFRSAGRPILWSGDLGACRRVNKIAARARRAGGRRPSFARKRR